MTPTKTIPKHLMPFVATQDASLYTPIDHASWRYIIKLSKSFFKDHACNVYLDGLEATGIHTERIPLISEMDEKVQKFGWRAVPIVGFIPSSAFMEFLSLGILPIACDMRKLENLHYTPAPDIVHEAAGHAPILADPDFAQYLRGYGEIARKVIYTEKDELLYQAVRKLSDLKENPRTSAHELEEAQKDMEKASSAIDEVSESTALTRMGWWTFEYGLIGPLENPKIYGAGLLSSVGESYNCFSETVKKIPFSIDCINQPFDITKPQPQLFITPDFKTLTSELEKLAQTMAYRLGGVFGLQKAKSAKTLTTTVLNSGIQIGGVLSEIIYDENGNPIYLKFNGPAQLAFEDNEIEGQGPKHHAHGFGTPVGKIKSITKATTKDRIEFESGLIVEGVLNSKVSRSGVEIINTFTECKVTKGSEVYFDPSWGVFDMAIGETVVSVFGGPPDRAAYIEGTTGFIKEKPTQSSNKTSDNKDLCDLYEKLRAIRASSEKSEKKLKEISDELDQKYPDDWLLRYELLELNARYKLHAGWEPKVREKLGLISKKSKDHEDLIRRGLELL